MGEARERRMGLGGKKEKRGGGKMVSLARRKEVLNQVPA